VGLQVTSPSSLLCWHSCAGKLCSLQLKVFWHEDGAVCSSETLAQTYQTARSQSMTIRDFKTLTTQAVYYKEHWSEFVQPLLKSKSNEYYVFWECVCSLWYPAMQCTCAAFSSLACTNILFFPHYHKRHGFRRKTLLQIKCVFWFSL
jgi:hypothetical protein